MKHMKRNETPKNWPITRKGTKFVVKPKFSNEKGIPILVALRDSLKIAKTRKEVKRALASKNILVNGKVAKDERNSLVIHDILTIVPSQKNYKLTLNPFGKFTLEETKDADKKVSKVMNKKMLKGKKMQLNLMDGRNFLTDLKCNVDDSVLIDLKNKKVIDCLELKENANVLVFAGKHSGKTGKIESIDEKTKRAIISNKEDKTNILIKQLMVT